MRSECEDKIIYKLLYQLECKLLKSEVRKSAESIAELLTEDFIEFTSSGKIANYKLGEVFQSKNDNTELNWEIKDFKIKELATNCILATYKVIKHGEIDERKKHSIRSSIWKCFNGNWKMIFHQGTLSAHDLK